MLDITEGKARYDRCAKKLLSFKAIDAWILKACVEEFSCCAVEYISEHCLTGAVEISEHAVHQDQPNRNHELNGDEQVTQMNAESSSVREGTAYFDIRFNAVAPGDVKPISLIINLEIQTDDKPGYELVTRGTYYCARMLSEQHGTIFTDDHYEKLRKVYSIWVCPSVPQHRKNGIFCYRTIEEAVLGERYVEKEAYDLYEVIILNLGDAGNETGSSILDLLNTLFSAELSSAEKKSILSKRYHIAMTKEMESEVQHMCNLSDWVENKGIVKGIDIGNLDATIRYYKRGRISLKEAADDLNLTVDQFKEKLNQYEYATV